MGRELASTRPVVVLARHDLAILACRNGCKENQSINNILYSRETRQLRHQFIRLALAPTVSSMYCNLYSFQRYAFPTSLLSNSSWDLYHQKQNFTLLDVLDGRLALHEEKKPLSIM